MDNANLYRFARFVPFHLKIFLGRTRRASLSPPPSQNIYVFHVQHKLKLPCKKTEQTSI